MRLWYISSDDIPSEKARAFQIVKMCEAFALNNNDVTLMLPGRIGDSAERVFRQYGVQRRFTVSFSIVFSLLRFIGITSNYRLRQILFASFRAKLALLRQRKDTVVFTREYIVAFWLALIGYRVIFEAHHPMLKKSYFAMLRRCRLIVTNSAGTAEEFSSRGFKNVHALANGVDLALYSADCSKAEARERTGLDRSKKTIVYAGSLYPWKGIECLIDAVGRVHHPDDYQVVLVGGSASDVQKYRRIAVEKSRGNVSFVGYQQPHKVPLYLLSADVLVIADLPTGKRSTHYTAPIKMFEYLASRRPVVAPDLPSMRSLVSESEVLFYTAGDSDALARAIEHAIASPSPGRLERGRSLAEQHTWQQRASGIMMLCNQQTT